MKAFALMAVVFVSGCEDTPPEREVGYQCYMEGVEAGYLMLGVKDDPDLPLLRKMSREKAQAEHGLFEDLCNEEYNRGIETARERLRKGIVKKAG